MYINRGTHAYYEHKSVTLMYTILVTMYYVNVLMYCELIAQSCLQLLSKLFFCLRTSLIIIIILIIITVSLLATRGLGALLSEHMVQDSH